MFEAKILADSQHPNGSRLTTFELTYPRFVHSELMTHRKFSRNSASSRAIPTKVLMRQVLTNPVVPIHWGKLQKGMQAFEQLDKMDKATCNSLWLKLRDEAMYTVNSMLEIGLHKQIANRLLEPWMWITVIVTSDERGLYNFFRLRVDAMAEPHIKRIAEMMFDLYVNEKPTPLIFGGWHLPFISKKELEEQSTDDCISKSVARCARGSYLQHNGDFTFEEDVALGEKLSTSGHWSPFEHQAMATQTPNVGGNFCNGWYQNRKFFSDESGRFDSQRELAEFIASKGF